MKRLVLVLACISFSLAAEKPVDYSKMGPTEIRELAEKGIAEAQFQLAGMYVEGRGVARDRIEAFEWTLKAAEQNLADAQFNVGVMYQNGVGVPKDEAAGAKWYLKAAAQNHAEAQYNLGVMCLSGVGMQKSQAEALKWWQKAAKQNDALSQFNLGLAYAKGLGVVRNPVKADAYLKVAAANKLGPAKVRLEELEPTMTAKEKAEAARMAAEFMEKLKEKK